MLDKIKIKVSSFLIDILENDALRFGFLKNGQSNKNALLNKLIPTLIEVRKARRIDTETVLTRDYNRTDSENIYNAINTVIDQVYFNDVELHNLEEYLWIRPTKEALPSFDEIETSETHITAQEVPVYIRGLLNQYALFPQYKRELFAFDKELDLFSTACLTHQIVHFRDKTTNEHYKAFAFDYVYGYLYDQNNYCIIYDLENALIKAIPLHDICDIYLLKQKHKPNEWQVECLRTYTNMRDFEKVIDMEI